MNIARNNVKPSLLPLFERIEAQGRRIARITIQKDRAGPFSAQNSSSQNSRCRVTLPFVWREKIERRNESSVRSSALLW